MVFKPQTFHEIPPQAEIDDPTDAALEAAVAAALGRAGLVDASRVSVTTKDGTVILDGFVGSQTEVGMEDDVAARIEGVKRVDNRLRIQSAAV